MVYPVVLGAGARLFGETSDKKPMRLVDTQTVGDGIAILTYEPVRDAERASDGAGLQDKRAAARSGYDGAAAPQTDRLRCRNRQRHSRHAAAAELASSNARSSPNPPRPSELTARFAAQRKGGGVLFLGRRSSQERDSSLHEGSRMPDVRIHRYAVAPADLDEFLVRRAALIRAVRVEHPGLVDARLIRLRQHLHRHVAMALRRGTCRRQSPRAWGSAAGVRAAMSLTRDASSEDGEIIASSP